jgi:6-pyruvoyltetrahydropterin/6-carboxytetrahydropterin synthase
VYRIAKQFTVEAAHRLGGLPEGHKCARRHGHSYRVEVILAATVLRGPGFVVDFADLGPLKRHLEATLDHRDLNEVMAVEPTSENLARGLFEWCAAELGVPAGVSVEAVRVSETPATWAEYRPHAGAGEAAS